MGSPRLLSAYIDAVLPATMMSEPVADGVGPADPKQHADMTAIAGGSALWAAVSEAVARRRFANEQHGDGQVSTPDRPDAAAQTAPNDTGLGDAASPTAAPAAEPGGNDAAAGRAVLGAGTGEACSAAPSEHLHPPAPAATADREPVARDRWVIVGLGLLLATRAVLLRLRESPPVQ